MASDNLSNYGSEYLPGTSDEEERDVSGNSDVYDDSDEEICGESASIVKQGWSFMASQPTICLMMAPLAFQVTWNNLHTPVKLFLIFSMVK